MNKQKI